MLCPCGDLPTGQTVPFFFPAYDSNGASVTITGLAVTDIEIYKGTSMTQRASDSGYALIDTDGIDLDSRTGIHGFSIDMSDNSDAGFYAAGSFYHIVVDAVTIDSQTVRFIFSFSLGFNLRPATAGRTLGVESDGDLTKVNTLDGHTAQTGDSYARIGAAGASLTDLGGMSTAMKAEVNAEADTALTDYDPPTRAEATSDKTEILAAQTTAQNDLDLITGTDGATLATLQGNYAPAKAGDEMDLVDAPNTTAVSAIQSGLAAAAKLLAYVQLMARSDSAIETDNATELNEINADGGSGAGNFSSQTDSGEALRDHIGDGTNLTEAGGDGDHLTEAGGTGDQFTAITQYIDTEIAAILAAVDTEVAAVLADTNELQADWADGGRLDLLLDAIKVVTDALTSAGATKLALSMSTLVTGTVSNAVLTPTTTAFAADDITEATADHFIGRTIIFTSGALQDQATDITDYSLVSSEGNFTVTALTEAPANDDTFIII